VWREIRIEHAELAAPRYVQLLTSYANGAGLAETIRERVALVVAQSDTVEIADYIGMCVARRRR
jgi:hypothetical protein